jgi:hypothetical protein
MDHGEVVFDLVRRGVVEPNEAGRVLEFLRTMSAPPKAVDPAEPSDAGYYARSWSAFDPGTWSAHNRLIYAIERQACSGAQAVLPLRRPRPLRRSHPVAENMPHRRKRKGLTKT